MYTKEIIFGMSLYEMFLIIGVIYALAVVRIISDRDGIRARLQNLVIISAVLSVIGGYGMSVVVQAVYNYFASGEFVINAHTGSTFYGGLVGGAVIFLAIYFISGHFLFKDRYHIKNIVRVTDIAAAGIAGAHGFGRIGCLMAGCCYGRPTDSFIGVWNEVLGYKVVPIQLFEALFLFALSAFIIYRCIKNRTCCLSIYIFLYGIWRFFIEFFRDDYRGSVAIKGISPSQFMSAALIIVGIIFYLFVYRTYVKKGRPVKQTDGMESGGEDEK